MISLRKDGLTDETYNKITLAFRSIPEIEKAVLYGSRAKGTYKPGSDIDLTLYGNLLKTSHLAQIENMMDDLFLPYKFDISIYSELDNPNLKNNINKDGILFYQR